MARVHRGIFAPFLTVKDEWSKYDLYPTILAYGTTPLGEPAMEVEIIAGSQTVADYQKKAENIASGWRVPRVEVTELRTNVVLIKAIMHEDGVELGNTDWQPVAENIASIPVAEYVRNLPMGKDVETGKPWTLDISSRNYVVGGQPGWGKSSFINALLAHLALHPDVRFCYGDFKDGTEASAWRDRADLTMDNRAPLDDDDFDPDGVEAMTPMLELVKAIRRDMSRRSHVMESLGATNVWTADNPTGAPLIGPDMPVKVLIVDECSALFATGDAKFTDEMINRLRLLAEKGRAYGYIILLATQTPTVDSIPGRIRSKLTERLAFRMDETGMYAVLGSSYVPTRDALNPRNITREGQAVVEEARSQDGNHLIQISWLSNERRREVIAASAHYRSTFLDEVPAKAETVEPTATATETEPMENESTGATRVDMVPVSLDKAEMTPAPQVDAHEAETVAVPVVDAEPETLNPGLTGEGTMRDNDFNHVNQVDESVPKAPSLWDM